MVRVLALLGSALAATASESVELSRFAVAASRLPSPATAGFGPSRVLGGELLATATTLDWALRRDPSFGLFRRSDSLTANPTAQGVALRGVGPSGAGRALVLLDGVPLNDPFGGWIAWSSIPVLSLAAAEIRPGGGSAAWGGAALGGVVALISNDAAGSSSCRLRLAAGSQAHRQGELSLGTARGGWAAAADLRWLETQGHHPLRQAERGTIDRSLNVRTRAARMRFSGSPGGRKLELGLRLFDEERGNGTIGQGNRSHAAVVTMTVSGRGADSRWRFSGYGQSQGFASRFTSVAADRSGETPANDQFAVPATAWGGSFTWTAEPGAHRLVAGVDLRSVRGETREDFLFNGGAFTRRRHAGGGQQSLGGFAGAETRWGQAVDLRVLTRFDAWRQAAGWRREVARPDGAVQRDERYPERTGGLANGTIEMSWRPTGSSTVFRTSAYTAHRPPTLNELYRPFRIGTTSTEANPGLRLERLQGVEVGLETQATAWTMRATAFSHRMRDAVGNVTLARGPGFITRQRINLERVIVDGVEITAVWEPHSRWELHGGAVLSSGVVARAAAQPGLEGLDLAQAPRAVATASTSWRASRTTNLVLFGRWSSRQFEDDENRWPLAAAATVDLTLIQELGTGRRLQVDVANLLDAEVPVGRPEGGPISYAAGRSVRAAVTLNW